MCIRDSNAFDSSSGKSMGPLKGSNGNAIVEKGLWGIAFGNNLSNQPSNTLFFAAGPNDEADGVYGRIDLNTASSPSASSGSSSGTSSGGGTSIGM